MKTYEDTFKEIRKIIETEIESKLELDPDHKILTDEGTVREGICQILSKQDTLLRWKILFQFPQLILPYFLRIRSNKDGINQEK